MRLANRIIDLLEHLQGAGAGLGVTEIAERTGLPKSTVHGLLRALAGRSVVMQDPSTQKYSLGLGILAMASSVLRNRGLLLGVALKDMERLRDLSRETVCMHVPYGLERACVAQVESPDQIRYTMEVGVPVPLYSGATGKLLLAHMPDEIVDRVIAFSDLVPLTPYTVTDAGVLRRQLEQIREAGYAISYEERALLVSAVAAPIRDRGGQVIACLTIYGPRARLDEPRINTLLPELLATAASISNSIAAPVPVPAA